MLHRFRQAARLYSSDFKVVFGWHVSLTKRSSERRLAARLSRTFTLDFASLRR